MTASTLGHVPYAVSKHGVVALTKTAAFEYAKAGVRINAICPGYTRTEPVARVIEANPEALENLIAADVPMGRLAEPKEIARAVLWLSSDETGFVTGQALATDGGKLI